MYNKIIAYSDTDCNTKMRFESELADRYPFLFLSEAGKSVCGRRIPLIKLGTGDRRVLFSAAYHGNERITSSVLLLFVGRLCECFSSGERIGGRRAEDLLDETTLYILPTVNPDGCDISLKGAEEAGSFMASVKRISGGNYDGWSANARGVDINHNFDAGWDELHRLERKNGIYGPSPRRYGGTHPESEPETAAVCELCRSIGFASAFAFHSQGEVIYWQYGKHRVEGAAAKAVRMAELSGYALDAPVGLAVGGGFKDWFISEFSRPAFTVELGRGTNPLSAAMTVPIYEKIEEMLVYCLSVE